MRISVIPERNKLAVSFVRLASKAFLSPFFKTDVRGTCNIPQKGSFVLLPKHQRWEDIPLLGMSVKRPLYYVAKKELFDNFFSKRFIAVLGGLPIDRSRPARSRYTLACILRKLEDGEGMVVFPEGTYFKDRMGPGHTGLIRMIHSSINTLFIPAGVRYSHEKYRTSVHISFGEPIEGNNHKDVRELFNFIMTGILKLSGF